MSSSILCRRWVAELCALLCSLLMWHQFLSVACFSLNLEVALTDMWRKPKDSTRSVHADPWTIDGGASPWASAGRCEQIYPTWNAASCARNLALLVIFAVQHSFMGRLWVKSWSARWMGTTGERVVHLVSSCFVMQLLLFGWQPQPCVSVWSLDSIFEHDLSVSVALSVPHLLECLLGGVLHMLSAVSCLFLLLSLAQIQWYDLFGYRQAFVPHLKLPMAFQIHPHPMVYRVSRNPLFTALLAVIWCNRHMVSEGEQTSGMHGCEAADTC
jgi:hypothetical protein